MALPGGSAGSTSPGSADTAGPGSAVAASLGAPRRLTLEYPAYIRSGDSDVIDLVLDVNAENSSESPAPGLPIGSESAYAVAGEATLDLPGADLTPAGPVSEPLLAAEAAEYRWSVRLTAPGTYAGTAWLVLVFTDKATGEQTRSAISAQPLQLVATTLFGLGGNAARWLGTLGLLIAGVLALPSAADALRRLRGLSGGPD